jgi:allantoinase
VSDFDLVLQGDIVCPDRIRENGWVAVANGRVASIGEGVPPSARETQKFAGCWIFPGAIDAQVHSRSQKNQEGFEQSTRAAAAGGVTTICDMPFDDDFLICSLDRFESKKRDAAREAHVDVALFATIDPAVGTGSIAELASAGACAFKFSTFEAHPTRFPRTPTPILVDAFRAVAATGLVACAHNENQEVIGEMTRRAQALGMRGPEVHAWARPPVNEALAMLEIYEAGVTAGVHAHVVHCSIARGIEICESYKRQGHRVSVEVLLPFLFLSDEDVTRWGAFAKINPPIRSAAEREALWMHLVAGHVDLVSTDHVAWSRDRKSNPEMLKNNSGFPGLDLLLPLFVTGCIERGVDFSLVSRCLAFNPARHFRLAPMKGALEPGCDADIAVVERAEYDYDPARGHTCVDWSPYTARKLRARVAGTWRRGTLIFDGKNVVSSPGDGKFVRPLLGMKTAKPALNREVSAGRHFSKY